MLRMQKMLDGRDRPGNQLGEPNRRKCAVRQPCQSLLVAPLDRHRSLLPLAHEKAKMQLGTIASLIAQQKLNGMLAV